MNRVAVRNIAISLFVVVWFLLFHYQSVRHFYLEPLMGRELPRPKFLFPPAGWIMFYKVGDSAGHIAVYGVKNGAILKIDLHEIHRVRDIGYDNVHRGILGEAFNSVQRRPFCAFLERKFPEYDNFLITQVIHPDLKNSPQVKQETPVYTCRTQGAGSRRAP